MKGLALRGAFFYLPAMKRIGITIGDINGVGPEVALKAVCRDSWTDDVQFVLIGPKENIKEQASLLDLPDPESLPHVQILHAEQLDPSQVAQKNRIEWNPGKVTKDASLVAGEAIRLAVERCLSGELDAMVTAPICKEGFSKAGINFPGHTEYLAELTDTKRFGMMLMGGGLRVMLVTRHIPITAVPSALTQENIREAIELTGEALKLFDLDRSRIGVCGLNPHAGDGGVIGTEEETLINPAIHAVRETGYCVSDAVPGDTIFYEAIHGGYDAVVAMYHDQGLAPLKMLGFEEGINITLGLPIIRTSPDHGTAFGIAGKNEADPKSMCNAIKLAIDLAGKPNPWK